MFEPNPVIPLHPERAAGPRFSQAPSIVSFNRDELRIILNLYGRKVAAGDWRDYALDALRDQAVFSIFRRSGEMPLYRVIKDPRLARRQGAYAVVATSGQVLRRGHDLERVMDVLDKKVRSVEL